MQISNTCIDRLGTQKLIVSNQTRTTRSPLLFCVINPWFQVLKAWNHYKTKLKRCRYSWLNAIVSVVEFCCIIYIFNFGKNRTGSDCMCHKSRWCCEVHYFYFCIWSIGIGKMCKLHLFLSNKNNLVNSVPGTRLRNSHCLLQAGWDTGIGIWIESLLDWMDRFITHLYYTINTWPFIIMSGM